MNIKVKKFNSSILFGKSNKNNSMVYERNLMLSRIKKYKCPSLERYDFHTPRKLPKIHFKEYYGRKTLSFSVSIQNLDFQIEKTKKKTSFEKNYLDSILNNLNIKEKNKNFENKKKQLINKYNFYKIKNGIDFENIFSDIKDNINKRNNNQIFFKNFQDLNSEFNLSNFKKIPSQKNYKNIKFRNNKLSENNSKRNYLMKQYLNSKELFKDVHSFNGIKNKINF